MRANRKYLAAVALLAVLAVVFGLAGTVSPVSELVSPEQTSSDSMTHFMNPPTFDSGWLDMTDKCGQYFNVTHDLNTTEVFADIVGKQSLNGMGGEHQRNLGGTGVIPRWSRTYGGAESDLALSVVQTSDGGYALAGYTSSYGAGLRDFWLVKTDSTGNVQLNKTYGGAEADVAYSVEQTVDGGYALAGYTASFGAGRDDFWLVKTDAAGNARPGFKFGLAWTGLTNSTITLYRGTDDLYWNFVRVRIWLIKEPTWQYGDINQDGKVDYNDLYILARNYGKTFTALSLSGIIAITGIHTYRKRKRARTTQKIRKQG